MTAAGAPLIVGLGGTTREGSSTERALCAALATAEAQGARTRLAGGAFLADLPIYDPRPGGPTARQAELAELVRTADGLIIATPGYHGSLSGVMKNALDTLELLRDDARPYFSDRAVGVIVTAAGSQAAGTTLTAVRSIIHAMRGWPTPFGAALSVNSASFGPDGRPLEQRDAWQLERVAAPGVQLARMRLTT
ncbi:MAG: NADPH-dependent FMN reductase [Phenylobacterium sp.]